MPEGNDERYAELISALRPIHPELSRHHRRRAGPHVRQPRNDHGLRQLGHARLPRLARLAGRFYARDPVGRGHSPRRSRADARLAQVFFNLLVNAAESFDEPRREVNEVLVRVARQRGDEIVVEIRDNGRGIATEQLPRVFDPFFTTKPVGCGTGLGLFVCHGIVTAMGGDIAIDSEVGRGTTVRVRLPA